MQELLTPLEHLNTPTSSLVVHVFALILFTSVCRSLPLLAMAIQEMERLTFINTSVSWNEASRYCTENNMTLLSIESSAKQYGVDKYITQWNAYLTDSIWMGLHETDVSSPLQMEWSSNCAGDLSFHNFGTNIPSLTPDNQYCFGLNTSTTKWISIRCDVELQFICQQNIGACTFDMIPQYGCIHSLKKTSEVGLEDCLEECRQSILSDGQQCWGIGFWPNYSGDDCWKFFSFDPEICIKKKKYFSSVTLGIKRCFTSAISSPLINTTNSSIYPQSHCISSTNTGIQTEETTMTSLPSTTELQTTPLSTKNTTQETTLTSKSTTAPQTTRSSPGIQITSTASKSATTEPETTAIFAEIQITTDEATTVSTTTPQQTTHTGTTKLVLYGTADTRQNDSRCYCWCSSNNTIHAIDEEFKSLLAALAINRKSTSKYKRGLISAEDNRTSAIAIGYVGVSFLVFTLGTIVILDLPLLLLSLKKIAKLCCKILGTTIKTGQ